MAKHSTITVNKHPQYTAMAPVWQEMRDAQSQRLIKDRDDNSSEVNGNRSNQEKIYLPKSSGQQADFTKGEQVYQAGKTRAEFPDNLRQTESATLGLLAKSTLEFTLPSALEPLIKNFADNGDSSYLFNARINEQQVITSRCGLYSDLPKDDGNKNPIPYTSLFIGENVLDWNFTVNGKDIIFDYVLLNISQYERNADGAWEWVYRYKVLRLDSDGDYFFFVVDEENQVKNFMDIPEDEDKRIYPLIKGKKSKEIPFTFCNASDTMPDIQDPIYEGLKDACLKYYRNDANRQELLYMQTVAILTLIGFEGADLQKSIDAGIHNGLSSSKSDASAQFTEVSGAGLMEAREAQSEIKKDMEMKGVSLLEAGAGESGEALSIRLTTKMAKLTNIADASANAIEKICKIIARWSGLSDKEISVKPSKDFTDKTISIEDLVRLSDLMVRGDFSRHDLYNELLKAGKTQHETFEKWEADTLAIENGNDM